MQLTIEQALGTQYLMFYHAQWPVDLLVPEGTLNHSVDTVNQYITTFGTDLTKWTSTQQDAVARLLWVNWIYQRLGTEPIRKPILANLENNQLAVICGDTRLMALNLLLDPGTVGVVCTAELHQADQFEDWVPVRTNQDLIEVTGFGTGAHVIARPGDTRAVEWLEIGDHTTAHHLHSIDQRVSMMQNYLNQHPGTVFDTDWARSYIDWNRYAS